MNLIYIAPLRFLVLTCAAISALPAQAQPPGAPVYPVIHDKWTMESENSIYYRQTDSLTINDNIEMSGSGVSLWVKYAVDTAKKLSLTETVVFPAFRLKPNDTHASLMYTFSAADLPRFFAGDKPLYASIINGDFYADMNEKVTGIRQNGMMQINSVIAGEDITLEVHRQLFPAADKPAAFESVTIINKGKTALPVTMEFLEKTIRTAPEYSEPVPHYVTIKTLNPGTKRIGPGEQAIFGLVFYASNDKKHQHFDLDEEKDGRQRRLDAFAGALQLETPDSVINGAFAFARRRISESIFDTKAGPMMCPGGLKYYAAIWANDEAEYANPFYAFTGDEPGLRAAVNTYGMFGKYMNDAFTPLPSSIIAEGDSIWAGAGDRGDQAMIASGAGRFALLYGNADTARKLWPLISWCLEYCRRKLNQEGVLTSNSDELEGRFPAGTANLSASSLYYDALLSAAYLSRSLGFPAAQKSGYEAAAKKLAGAIERYFGAEMKGFHSYRYYKENTLLRSWICMPLAMGIMTRKKGTIDALLSPALFSPDGILTQEGTATFWDRSTLYSLRGIFAAGETKAGIAFLHYYSERRLLGDHVPYPVEAYPEGNQRHLAGESALYCRIFTEGLFGIRPTGLRSFDCTPRLPAGWPKMAMKQIACSGARFDLMVERAAPGKLTVTINRKSGRPIQYRIKEGDTIPVDLK